MDVNKIKLLLCSSDQIHTKTSQIKIYKEKLNQSFETTFFDVFSYFKLYGRSETEKYIKNIINKFQVLIITTDKPYYSFDVPFSKEDISYITIDPKGVVADVDRINNTIQVGL